MRPILPAFLARHLLIGPFLWFTVTAINAQTGMVDVAPSTSRADQPARSQNGFVLKKTVRRVILDVVVSDTQGNAVPGLSKKDFSIDESGKSQRVLSFEAHDFRAPAEALPALPALPPNTFVNLPGEPERGPLYVIVYDAVDMLWDDQPLARKQLADFLASKPAGTRFAMFIITDGLHLAQGFTTDPKELLAVLDVHRKTGAHIPWFFLYGDNYGADNFLQPLEVLTHIARYLQGLPGRKNIIWMASSMPDAMPRKPVGGTYLGGPVDYEDETREAVSALTAAQVSVYPVDVHGLDQFRAGIDFTADRIAEDTGGRAYYNTNDVKAALVDAVQRGSSYYELSYSPSNQNYDGKLRKIRVELSSRFAKKGYRLAYRRYYYGTDFEVPSSFNKPLPEVPEHPVATKFSDPLIAHLEHGAPMVHDLVFRARVSPAGAPAMGTPEQMANLIDEAAYIRAHRKNKPVKPPKPIPLQTYTIDYTVLDRALHAKDNPASAVQPVMEFAAAAFDSEGKLMNGMVQNATQIPRSSDHDANGKALYRVQQTLDVPTKAAWLRVAVRDLSTNSIGTLEIPLPLAAEPGS